MNKNINYFSNKDIRNHELSKNSFGNSLKRKLVPKINLNDLIKKPKKLKKPLFGLKKNIILTSAQTERSRKSIINEMLNKKDRIKKK